MNVKIKRLRPNAALPVYGSASAAGADLTACLEENLIIRPGETALVPTGLALAVHEGTAGFVYARSGLALKQDLAPANKVGVIDADYRGEVMVAVHNHGHETRVIEPGERIAQLVIAPVIRAEFDEGELDDTARGAGGFGSTGTK